MAIPQYLVAFKDEHGSVHVSTNAIAKSILNYLGDQPTDKAKFEKTDDISEKIDVSIEHNKPVIVLKILVMRSADISSLVFLLQEKVKTAMVEDLNIPPEKVTIEIINYYDSK